MPKKEIKEEKVEETKILSDEEKKKKLIELGAIALVLIVIIFAVVFFFAKGSKPNLETQLNKSLENMGKDFYTNFYYVEMTKNKSSEEVSEFLSKYQDIGIKVDLDNLSRYDGERYKDEVAKFKNEDGKACDMKSSRAIIKPKAPYGKDDYTITVELECGFAKAEK